MDFQVTKYSQRTLKPRPCGDPCHNRHKFPTYRKKIRKQCSQERSLILRKDGTWYTVHSCNFQKALKYKTTMVGAVRDIEGKSDDEKNWVSGTEGDEEEPIEGYGILRTKVAGNVKKGRKEDEEDATAAVETPKKKQKTTASPKTPGSSKRSASTSPTPSSLKKVRFDIGGTVTEAGSSVAGELTDQLAIQLKLGGTPEKPDVMMED